MTSVGISQKVVEHVHVTNAEIQNLARGGDSEKVFSKITDCEECSQIWRHAWGLQKPE